MGGLLVRVARWLTAVKVVQVAWEHHDRRLNKASRVVKPGLKPVPEPMADPRWTPPAMKYEEEPEREPGEESLSREEVARRREDDFAATYLLLLDTDDEE